MLDFELAKDKVMMVAERRSWIISNGIAWVSLLGLVLRYPVQPWSSVVLRGFFNSAWQASSPITRRLNRLFHQSLTQPFRTISLQFLSCLNTVNFECLR
jgi:hypothetical protein